MLLMTRWICTFWPLFCLLGRLAFGQGQPQLSKEVDNWSERAVTLPCLVDSAMPAGAGKYLLLHLGKLRKLALLDVQEGVVAGYVDLPSDEVFVAAGTSDM